MYARLASEVLPELIPPNSTILAAVSGGPDSVALTHILWKYIREHKEQNLSMVMSHVHHGARKESDAEELMVRELAEKLGLAIIVHRFNAKKYAKQQEMSFQEAAREWRYTRWRQDMGENNCNLLATAHHLGDQAETIIYRLLRGSGTAGLAGIYPVRDQIIRPLLSVRKETLLAYCQEEGLTYAVDYSNLEPVYDRNKIRLELIPLLEQYNSRLQEVLGRTAELLRWDEEFIDNIVELKWNDYSLVSNRYEAGLSFQAWQEKEAVLSRLIRKAGAIVSGDQRGLEYKFIKLIIKEGNNIGWSQDLPGMKVEARKNGFYIFRGELDKVHINKKPQTMQKAYKILVPTEGWQEIPGKPWKIGLFTEVPQETRILYTSPIDEKELQELGNYGALVCRTRKEGDRMYFKGIGHKSLKKVFQENEIPAASRMTHPLLAVGSLIIWIPGIKRSDTCFPSLNTGGKHCVIGLSDE